MTLPTLDSADLNAVQPEIAQLTAKLEKHCQNNKRDGERQKVYSVIHSRLLKLECFLSGSEESILPEGFKRSLEDWNKRFPPTEGKWAGYSEISIQAAWNFSDSLRELLVELGPDEYIYQELLREKGRSEEASHRWQDFFGADDLDTHIKHYEERFSGRPEEKNASLMGITRGRLLGLYRIRNQDGLHNRAREMMRGQYLKELSNKLILFMAVVLVFLYIFTFPDIKDGPSSGGWETAMLYGKHLLRILIVPLAGSLGAVLAMQIRFRRYERITEIKSGWQLVVPQSVFGAVMAIVILIIMMTGWVTFGDEVFTDFDQVQPVVLLIIGFISGYSEPFALGILEKVLTVGKG